MKLLEWLKKVFSAQSKPAVVIPIKPGVVIVPKDPAPKNPRELGIDVSHHNGVLDWSKIKAGGVSFAFIKATEATGFIDGQLIRNVQEAQKQGIKVGAYHFFRAGADGGEQARHFMKMLLGLKLDLPCVLDWEVDDGQSASKNITEARRWLSLVEETTKQAPIIYTGPSFFSDKMKSPSGFERYPLWIAHYGAMKPRIPAPWQSYAYWQFTETGELASYPGKKFDLNYSQGPSPV